VPVFRLVRDARGSLVHVRKDDGECIGCIEVGLFEIVKALVLDEEAAARQARGHLLVDATAPCADRIRRTNAVCVADE
jgi:hypothetical protein